MTKGQLAQIHNELFLLQEIGDGEQLTRLDSQRLAEYHCILADLWQEDGLAELSTVKEPRAS